MPCSDPFYHPHSAAAAAVSHHHCGALSCCSKWTWHARGSFKKKYKRRRRKKPPRRKPEASFIFSKQEKSGSNRGKVKIFSSSYSVHSITMIHSNKALIFIFVHRCLLIFSVLPADFNSSIYIHTISSHSPRVRRHARWLWKVRISKLNLFRCQRSVNEKRLFTVNCTDLCES